MLLNNLRFETMSNSYLEISPLAVTAITVQTTWKNIAFTICN
ncbi:hypothetical protein H1P_1100018 [Hyella patelloides LEGE 07179]|uniref:Uncharacterized protein n=1 Tax=Hyella patelloides LEGE 07179 TaxID=945734 RepID=A0A563VJL8_9CYAN|nr:hypothetical protein H1P_1100018 [Hyella patelloides LEGE 07179]